MSAKNVGGMKAGNTDGGVQAQRGRRGARRRGGSVVQAKRNHRKRHCMHQKANTYKGQGKDVFSYCTAYKRTSSLYHRISQNQAIE